MSAAAPSQGTAPAVPADAAAAPAARPSALRRALDALFWGAGALAALSVLAICVLILLQSAGRELGLGVGGINDVVAWLTAAAAFLAMAHSFREGDFVRVTLVLEKLSAAMRRRLEMVSLAVGAVATAYLAYWAVSFTYDSYRFHEMANGLIAIPIWIPQTSFAVGAVLLCLAVLDQLWTVLRGGKPLYVLRVEERHARGDYSEDM
jgi:TRAP-type C4-dicarboxylate transport system permease small subunit